MNAQGPFQFSRRTLLRVTGAGALGLVHNELAFAHNAREPLDAAHSALQSHLEHLAPKGDTTNAWSASPGKARYRIEGVPKVTGQKIYARDFRAKDIPGWPAQERLALVLRATMVEKLFSGIDLSILPAALQPLRVVTQEDLIADKLTAPSSAQPPQGWDKGLLVAKGARPVYFGQPVAILIFANFDTFRRAKKLLQFNPSVMVYGARAPVPPVSAPYAPSIFLTRYETPGEAPFSQVQSGASNPNAQPPTEIDLKAKELRNKIDQMFAHKDVRSFGGMFSTQVLDPMFMEPEAGLAWVDKSVSQSSTLHLVLGTQATNGDMADTLGLFAVASLPFTVKTVVLNSCYPGGGFGGRDVSTFPPLLAIAAAYSDAPVRIAQDRYEQFQSGLKQLDSHIDHAIAVDKRGKFVAFRSSQQLHGGGNNNYSQYVAMLTGYCGLSGYQISKAYVDAKAIPSPGVISGSMRGFGGPQASFCVETLVDEAAVALKIDPIGLRLRNALRTGERTITGAPLTQDMTLAKICQIAMKHPLWRDRERTRRIKALQGIDYGVGFALANQAYGTGTDGVMAEVVIAVDGTLTVRSNCVDMGNGSATTLAISTAGFAGNNAHHVVMGDAAYFAAPLAMTSGSSGNWSIASWTPTFSMSSSACLTAFHQVHVTEQATRVLFETGILPAAALLWGVDVGRLRGKTFWRERRLHFEHLKPLDIASLARQMYSQNLCVAAMAHGLYQGRWVQADYAIAGWRAQLPIDGLSVRYANQTPWQSIVRSNTIAPEPDAHLYGRSLFAPSGMLAAVEIAPRTGQVKVVGVELWVDAGKVLQPDLLQGQAQGGIAMGIGYALLENLPLLQDGAGDGRWNLDRYHVALASDMPMGRMHIHTLPTNEKTAKGIAEAVLCPVAPAIGNAIAHATGKRFRSLPITAAQIKGGA